MAFAQQPLIKVVKTDTVNFKKRYWMWQNFSDQNIFMLLFQNLEF